MYKFLHTFFLLCNLSLFFAESVFSAQNTYPQTQFVANISSNVPDWRPQKAYNADEAQILLALYEGLFVYDPYSLEPIPALAESWTLSKDSLTWTFTIRKNARFQNGDPITAQTFKTAWLNLLSPQEEAPYASLLDPIVGAMQYRTGVEKDPNTVGINTDGDRTLIVKLQSPAEHLPKILCHHAFSAIHSSNLSSKLESTKVGQTLVSSGPYILKSYSDSQILLEKNNLYWDESQVAIPSIKLILSDNAKELTQSYNQGDIHWLSGAANIERILDSTTIHISPMFATEYFFFRTTWGTGADATIRKALLLAISWDELRASYLIPASTLLYPIPGYPEISGLSTKNIEEAKKLLKDAQISIESTAPIYISIPESQNYSYLASILKSNWEQLGFTVSIETKKYSDYYGSLRNNTYTVGITSWIGDFADPLSFLEMFRAESSLNDSGWNNDQFEKLLSEALAQKNRNDRYSKFAEAEKVLLSEAVIIPLSHNPSVNIIDVDYISGWYANALDIHSFKFLKFVQKKALPGVALLH